MEISRRNPAYIPPETWCDRSSPWPGGPLSPHRDSHCRTVESQGTGPIYRNNTVITCAAAGKSALPITDLLSSSVEPGASLCDGELPRRFEVSFRSGASSGVSSSEAYRNESELSRRDLAIQRMRSSHQGRAPPFHTSRTTVLRHAGIKRYCPRKEIMNGYLIFSRTQPIIRRKNL